MSEVSSRITTAYGTAASLVHRPLVAAVASVLDADFASTRKERPVARVARGHHAIEHINSAGDSVDYVFGRADSHQVSRLVFGKPGRDVGDHIKHCALFFADRQPADCVSVKADLKQPFKTALAKVWKDASLIDSKQGLRRIDYLEFGALGFPSLAVQFCEPLFRPARPVCGHLKRVERLF